MQAKPTSMKEKQTSALEPSPVDIEKHQKQIMVELQKDSVNHEAVKNSKSSHLRPVKKILKAISRGLMLWQMCV